MLALGDFSFGGLDARIHLLWPVLALIPLAILSERRRRRAALRFLAAGSGTEWLRIVAVRRRWRTALVATGLLVLLFAALQPRSNPVKVREKAKVRDLAILLDVSRSMLAEDRAPNRLESVKLELARLADRLDGDRVGLVAFAGDAVVVCPLTSNYSYFKRTLRNVTVHTAGQGGTRIGDAIRKALKGLLHLNPVESGGRDDPARGEEVVDALRRERPGRFADLLLVTDGEDHDSYPEYAARSLASSGVGLYIVGVGSPEGEPVPVGGGLLRYQGKVVKSALDDAALRELVVAAGRGSYLPAAVHHFDLVDFFESRIRRDDGKEVREERVVWQEVFQPFVLGGLLLVLLGLAVPLRRRSR